MVRRGHIGYGLYFIFSGAVKVTLETDTEDAFSKPGVAILRKGSCFGEVALVKNVRRQATVITASDTEVLVVDRHDFHDFNLHKSWNVELESRHKFLKVSIKSIALIKYNSNFSVVKLNSRKFFLLILLKKKLKERIVFSLK